MGNKVERIILARPTVEAAKASGFLPGDLQDRVDPHILEPLYDAIFEIVGQGRLLGSGKWGLLEVVPLAYMRGRTLDGFIYHSMRRRTLRVNDEDV